ncbi:MAG: hypothetical protein ACI85O_000124 [Saprospiraceae bacterium]|jgi:hypothetical protein
MTRENSLKTNSKQIIWKTIQFLLGFCFVLIGIFYFISTSKFKNLIPELITQYAQEKYDVNLNFSSCVSSRSENFPFLTFKIKNLSVKKPDCTNCDDKTLTINRLQFKIQPWDLLKSFVNINDLRVTGAKILLHKEKTIRTKSSYSENSTAKKIGDLHKIRLNTISLKDVFIEYKDDVKEKYFGVNFKEANVLLQPKNEKVDIKIDANCFFEGLTFKQENGAFLKKKDAALSLNLEIIEDFIVVENSTLQVDKDTIQLNGSYKYTDIPFLDLHISTPNILLKNALALLDDKLQKTLSTFKINQELKAYFHIQSELKPKHRPTIDLNFETVNADLNFNKTRVTDMDLQASYSNHCQTRKGDLIQRGEDCLTVHSVTGNLFDVHPVNLSGIVHDFKKLNLEMAGTAILDLPSLQPYLTKTLYELKQGKAELEIDYKGNFGTLLKGRFAQKSGISVDAKIKNTVFNHDGFRYTNVSGNLHFGAKKTNIYNFRATRQKTLFLLNGEIDNILDFTFNERGRLQSDLRLNIVKINTENFLPKGKKSEIEKVNPATLFANTIENITKSLEGKVAVTIGEISHQKFLAKNSSFSLFLKETKAENNQAELSDFFQIKNLKTTLADSIQIGANILIKDIETPKTNAKFTIKTGLIEANNYIGNETLELINGQIFVDGTSSFLLNDLQNLSLSDVEKLNFNGKMTIQNGVVFLKKNQQNFTAINTNIDISPHSIYIDNLQGKVANIEVGLSGKINNYLALLTENKTTAQADLNLDFGTIDIDKSSTKNQKKSKFTPQNFLLSLEPILSKIGGHVIIKIDELKTPIYPINNVVFKLTTGTNKQQKCFLLIENFEGALFNKTLFYADFKITDFKAPLLYFNLKCNMPVSELSTLIQDDNFQTIKGMTSIELAYKNTINDSFNLQDYLLTGDMKARVGFKNADISYAPRGLRFAELNGGVSFTEKNLTVDFPRMLFNNNEVNLSGEAHDFLPFFFEENKDFTVDLTMNSPLINFHNFDTPKTLKEKEKTVQSDTIKTDTETPIDRLLSEGNLSLRTKINEVIYENFRATNIIGHAKINDNEVVLDTFTMQTSDGLFGINSVISDIDKEKICLSADITLDKINASKVLKSFDNFNQTTLTNNNIIGVVDAKISLSTDLNDNYEIYPDAMNGNLDLTINKGAFINFNGLTNLDGFLFKKRKLDAVYFDTLRTSISLSGRDMKFAPTVLNSTAATLTVEGVYTFSEEDRTDMIIEVPLGNIFTRYVERVKIRKNHKKRTGLPIIVEVTEKDKVLDFNIKLRRDHKDR